jgi:hypothetical protein
VLLLQFPIQSLTPGKINVNQNIAQPENKRKIIIPPH